MQDLVRFGTGKVRGKGYVEGQVDGTRFGCWLGHDSRRALRTSQWLRRRHSRVLMEPRHAKRCRSHPFPAMTGLASEVADLVHPRFWMTPQVIDVRKGVGRGRGAMVVASRRIQDAERGLGTINGGKGQGG